ncbi:MAG: hypothetical protein ACOYLO_08990, partial [Ferruginibacter sp.]
RRNTSPGTGIAGRRTLSGSLFGPGDGTPGTGPSCLVPNGTGRDLSTLRNLAGRIPVSHGNGWLGRSGRICPGVDSHRGSKT